MENLIIGFLGGVVVFGIVVFGVVVFRVVQKFNYTGVDPKHE